MFVEYLGREALVQAKVKDNVIRILTNSQFVSENEEKVYLQPDPEKIHMFVKETEESISI